MRGLILLFSLVCLACNYQKPATAFTVPDETELQNIIATIICRDSLGRKYTICKDLQKFYVIGQSTDTSGLNKINKDEVPPPPPPLHTIYLKSLLRNTIDGKPFFTHYDYSYLLFQNSTVKTLSIKNKMECHINSISKAMIEEQNVSFSEFTIPVLSKNGTRAYVEYTFHCNINYCSTCSVYYLEKINNNWVIIHRQLKWIS